MGLMVAAIVILTLLPGVLNEARGSATPSALLNTITLERPYYVRTRADNPVLVSPGTFQVTLEDISHLRLSRHGSAPMIVVAQAGTHDQDLLEPFSVVVEDPEHEDLLHIGLFLPGGQLLDAIASASGVFPREIPIHIFTAFAKNWASGSPVKNGLRIEPKTVRAGQDYDTVVLPSGVCAVLCERDDRCQAFTWRPQPATPTRGTCHLKDVAPPKETDECCTSGVKRTHRDG